MDKKEMLLLIDNMIEDENTRKIFTFLVSNVSDIKDDISSIKDTVEGLEQVRIINGGGSKMPTTMKADDFHQMIYDRTTELRAKVDHLEKTKLAKGHFKANVKSLGWWADTLFKVLVVIAFLLYYFGAPHLADTVNKLPLK